MQTNLAKAFQTAETAEPDLRLVPPLPAGVVLVSADSIEELAERRQHVAEEARDIMARNSHLWHNGRESEVPPPSAPLGTAHQVIEVRDKFGENSPQHKRIAKGHILDNERLAGEAASRNGAAYFDPIVREFVSDEEGHSADGLLISPMTERGLTPLASQETQGRRINEHVEEKGTYAPIGSMIARRGLLGAIEQLRLPISSELTKLAVEVTTISECSDEAIRKHAINPKGAHEGMRPGMKGIALRRAHFEDDNSGDRIDESVIVDGTYITHDVILKFLKYKRVIKAGQTLSKTGVLGTQLVSVNGGPLLEFARELDDFAGAINGKRLYLGVEVPDDHPRDYSAAVGEAEERDQKLGSIPVELAELQIGLADINADTKVAEKLINELLKDRLMEVARQNPEMAAIIFDEATAAGLAKVAELEAQGRTVEAYRYAQEVYENAPDVSFCSGGGCEEIEEIRLDSALGQLVENLGLRGRAFRNKVAPCKNCGKKQLIHDLHGNTVCAGCHSTKLNGEGVRDGRDEKSK